MNHILQKCIQELKADNSRIDYVLGMLETLVDMDTPPTTPVQASPLPSTPSISMGAESIDESVSLENKTKAAMAGMPPLVYE